MKYLFTLCLLVFSLSVSAQWQQTGSKVRYVNGLGIPTRDTAAGVAADSSQILIRPADSSLYVKYKRTWLRVGGGGGSIAGSGTTNYIPKFTSSTAIGNSQIFDNGTNVGIGTTSPGAKLTISASGQALQLTSTSDVFLNISRGTDFVNIGNDATGTFYNTSTNHRFLTNTGTLEAMRITASGNVGINQTAPAGRFVVADGQTLLGTNTNNGVDRLQVSGSVNVSTLATTNNLSVTTNATVGGNITASGTLTAATIVKSGGTSSQALMANGSVLTVTSGTYTPTLSNNNGTSGLSLGSATYQRVGNIVTVYFLVSGTCTASLVNIFNITIPFGNNFTSALQAQGTGFSGTNKLSSYISAAASNNVVQVAFDVPAGITAFDMKGSFQYQVQ